LTSKLLYGAVGATAKPFAIVVDHPAIVAGDFLVA
jgi:hypothetical protein